MSSTSDRKSESLSEFLTSSELYVRRRDRVHQINRERRERRQDQENTKRHGADVVKPGLGQRLHRGSSSSDQDDQRARGIAAEIKDVLRENSHSARNNSESTERKIDRERMVDERISEIQKKNEKIIRRRTEIEQEEKYRRKSSTSSTSRVENFSTQKTGSPREGYPRQLSQDSHDEVFSESDHCSVILPSKPVFEKGASMNLDSRDSNISKDKNHEREPTGVKSSIGRGTYVSRGRLKSNENKSNHANTQFGTTPYYQRNDSSNHDDINNDDVHRTSMKPLPPKRVDSEREWDRGKEWNDDYGCYVDVHEKLRY